MSPSAGLAHATDSWPDIKPIPIGPENPGIVDINKNPGELCRHQLA